MTTASPVIKQEWPVVKNWRTLSANRNALTQLARFTYQLCHNSCLIRVIIMHQTWSKEHCHSPKPTVGTNVTCAVNEWGRSPLVEPLQKGSSPISGHTVKRQTLNQSQNTMHCLAFYSPVVHVWVLCQKINYINAVTVVWGKSKRWPNVTSSSSWQLFTYNLAVSLYIFWKTAVLSHSTGVLRLPRSFQEEECVSVWLQYEGNPVAIWIYH